MIDSNDDTLQTLKEMLIFRHENLLKEEYTRQDNLCKYYNLQSDSIKNELKDFKTVYKLMEKNIDVCDSLVHKEKNSKKCSEGARRRSLAVVRQGGIENEYDEEEEAAADL